MPVSQLAKYVEGYDRTKKWEFTDYDHARLMEVSERLARRIVVKYGGRVEKDAAGKERFVIPEIAVKPSAFFDSAAPGPVPENERLTDAERARIHPGS